MSRRTLYNDDDDDDDDDEFEKGLSGTVTENYDPDEYEEEGFVKDATDFVKTKVGEILRNLTPFKKNYYKGKNSKGRTVVVAKDAIRLEGCSKEGPSGGDLRARVTNKYEAKLEDELDLRVGDVIHKINKKDDDGWWEGTLRGVRGLFPSNFVAVIASNEARRCDYQIEIHTGDKPGAGTDSTVFVCLYGDKDYSDVIALRQSNHANKFERNQVDVFEDIRPQKILGSKLISLKIWHNNTFIGAPWYLEKVVVINKTLEITDTFMCRRWLATDEDDSNICRMLVPHDNPDIQMKDLEMKLRMDTYYVDILTSDEFNAGTDSNVFIELIGKFASTGDWPLKRNLNGITNKFERGQHDKFIIETVGIGQLQRVRIRSDGSSFKDSWKLKSITLDCPKFGRTYQCICDTSLEKETSLEFSSKPKVIKKYTPCIPYEISITTSSKLRAGTSKPVTIAIFGDDGLSVETSLALSAAQEDKMLKAGKSKVVCPELPDVGQVKRVRFTHLGGAWCLDHLEVRLPLDEPNMSEVYEFECNNTWVGKRDGTVQELVPTDVFRQAYSRGVARKTKLRNIKQLKEKVYMIETYTGNEHGAGTDANVFITVFGENGDTGERKLASSETHLDKFEKGNLDRFRFQFVDLGELTHVRIRHDNSMRKPDWYLDQIKVIDNDQDKIFVFPCGKWLSMTKDDKKLNRDLPVAKRGGKR